MIFGNKIKSQKLIKTIIISLLIPILAFSFLKLKKLTRHKNYELKIEKVNVISKNNEEYWILKTILKNNSKNTLLYASKSCSQSYYYLVSNNTFKIVPENCDKNGPSIITILPNDEHVVVLTVIKNKNNKTNFNHFQIILNLYKIKDSKESYDFNNKYDSKKRNWIYSNNIKIF